MQPHAPHLSTSGCAIDRRNRLCAALMSDLAAPHRVGCLGIARCAVASLHAELLLYPKPGLVSVRDNGSHDDMDCALFMRSIFSLRHYFLNMAQAGAAAAPFAELKRLGVRAEQRMLAATGGINTHRGAIFSLGLLCAAAGYWHHNQAGRSLSSAHLRTTLLAIWGEALGAHSIAHGKLSNGIRVAARYGVSGAREEAAKGFPSVFEIALPRLRAALAAGRGTGEAQIDALFSLMANVNDTNIYHRGGFAAAQLVKKSARQFLAAGGTAHPDWVAAASRCHTLFVQQRISPGGAADLLSASWFVHLLTRHEAERTIVYEAGQYPVQHD